MNPAIPRTDMPAKRTAPREAGRDARSEAMNAPETHEASPGLDGPDYVALVIEWEDSAATLVRPRAQPARTPMIRQIATVIGALIAIGVTSWGLHRLRTS
jgi:hypothetical protein